MEIESGGECFRGGEAGWCTPGLGGSRGGGGGKYFFSGPKCPPRFALRTVSGCSPTWSGFHFAQRTPRY